MLPTEMMMMMTMMMMTMMIMLMMMMILTLHFSIKSEEGEKDLWYVSRGIPSDW